MLYGIYKIQDIINKSGIIFGKPDVCMNTLKMLNEYDLRYDYAEMYNMISEIKVIIDKMLHEGDENNELQRSTGTEI